MCQINQNKTLKSGKSLDFVHTHTHLSIANYHPSMVGH